MTVNEKISVLLEKRESIIRSREACDRMFGLAQSHGGVDPMGMRVSDWYPENNERLLREQRAVEATLASLGWPRW